MHIGLTYDLREDYLREGFGEEETAEFDRVETVDAIAGSLQELGHQVQRIGRARNLVQRLAAAQAYSSYATAFVGTDDPGFRDVLLLRAKTYALQGMAAFPEEEFFAAAFAECSAPQGKDKLRLEFGSSDFWTSATIGSR